MFDLSIFIQATITGIFVGFLFALVAVGLTLIYGMMDMVNFAHGEMVLVGLYTAYWLWKLFGVDPLLSVPIAVLTGGATGLLAYRFLVRNVLKAPMVAQMFSTFGLSVFIASSFQFLWGPVFRTTRPGLASGRMELFGILFSRAHVIMGVVALVGFIFVYVLLNMTETGRALQATAQDKQAASLMGIDTEKMFALTWAIAGACVGVAGCLLANIYPAHPSAGFDWGLGAYVVVVLGGFGSVPGALLGAIAVGVVQVLSGVFIGTRYKIMLTYVLFLSVLILRPYGLLGKR